MGWECCDRLSILKSQSRSAIAPPFISFSGGVKKGRWGRGVLRCRSGTKGQRRRGVRACVQRQGPGCLSMGGGARVVGRRTRQCRSFVFALHVSLCVWDER